MATLDFQYYFRHSSIVQWLLDVMPLRAYLNAKGVNDAIALEGWLDDDDDQLEQLRQCLFVSDANLAALQFYGCKDMAEFGYLIRRYASRQQVQHLCLALLAIKDESSRYSYQTELTTSSGRKVLLVNCELPALADIHRGINISMMDITLLTDAEEELQEREQFLNATLKAVPDILMVFDFKTQRTLFQNVDLIERLGYSSDDISDTDNQLISYIIHPDDGMGKDAMLQIYDTLMAGEIYELTIRLQHFNGDWRHYYFRSAGLEKDKQGRLQSAVVIARDITDVLKTRQILSAQQKRYQLLADNFTDIIVTTDTDLKVTYVSPSIESGLGFKAEEFMALEKPLAALGLASEYQRLFSRLENLPARNEQDAADQEEVLESNAQTVLGEFTPVEITVSILRDEFDLLDGLLIIVRDISERLKREAENRLAAKVFSNSLEGIYITDSEGYITQANSAFYTITGFSEKYVIGKKPSQLSSGWREINFTKDIEPALKSVGSWSGEIMSRRANGEAFLTWMSISEVNDSRDQLIGIITSFRDITEAKNSEESIRKLAYYDPLTQLPNRQLLSDRLSQALHRANRNRHFVALLFLDLDGFKAVNDEHGHAMGDYLLKEVAKRLKACVRGDDTVARMGGDEFTVVLGALVSREAAENAAMQIAKKIIKSLNQVFLIQEKEMFIGASIGISLFPDDADADEALIKLADTAMYHAKSVGKNNYQFYTADMHQRAQKRMAVEKEISKALERNEFLLVYQPKFSLPDKKLLNFEALLRWQHPEQGLLAPASFLRALDEAGMGSQVGQWVIEQACQQMVKDPHLKVSINIFAKQYRDGVLVDSVAKALEKYHIAPARLTLEISEQLVMADTGVAYAVVSDLKALGVRISMDDFASSMLSITYLNRLPIDEVKIDRQFIESIDQSPQQLKLVNSIIALAKNLDLCVVAEGVERESQLSLLEQAQCDQVQGYLFSKPVFLEQLAALYAKDALIEKADTQKV